MGNILITGANGQLGSEIRALAADSKANKENKYFFTDVAELDITNAEAVHSYIRDNKISTVVNCAAYTNVDKAEDDPQTADLLNNKAVGNIAKACAAEGAFLFHISTDYVFGGDACTPYAENAAPAPTGVYGRTKYAGEQSVMASGCSYIIIRTAWLYSSYGNNFVKTMRRLTSEKPAVSVVFDQVGTPTFAGDLANAIVTIINSGTCREHCGIYHFSNEGVCSWYDFAIAIRDAFGNKCELKPCHSDEFPSKVKRPSFSVLDKSLIKKTFGVEVPYWKESLETCVKQL